jgi:hypothetical protein
VADWLSNGGDAEQLEKLADQAPVYNPSFHVPQKENVMFPYNTSTGEGRGKSVFDAEAKNVNNRQTTSNLSLAVKDWIVDTGGRWFTRPDLDKDLNIVTPEEKHTRRQIIYTMKEAGELEEHASVSGRYRWIDANCDLLDIQSASRDNIVPLKWPFRIESYADLYSRNLAVIAGSPNAGKSALLLNVMRMNLDNSNLDFVYFSSEMAEDELRRRLENFKIPIAAWGKCKFMVRSHNFADIIRPDSVNLIDYLEIDNDFYLIAGQMAAIQNRLRKGIALIALQKKRGAPLGRGAEFGLEKPRIYLTMDAGTLTIEKGKNWHDREVNPDKMFTKFKLVNGCDFQVIQPWTKGV